MPYVGLFENPLALAGVIVAIALLVAVIRAKQDDLPEIIRALMRLESRDDRRDDDSAKPPPLPKP